MRLRSRDPRPRATEPRRPPMMANRCPNRRTRSAATMQHTTEIFEASSIPAGNVEKSRHGHGARHACKRHRVNHAPFIFQAPRQVMSYGQRPKFRTPDPNVFPPRPIFSRSSITAPRRWGRCCRILGARTHARTHARTRSRTHALTRSRAHALTHSFIRPRHRPENAVASARRHRRWRSRRQVAIPNSRFRCGHRRRVRELRACLHRQPLIRKHGGRDRRGAQRSAPGPLPCHTTSREATPPRA